MAITPDYLPPFLSIAKTIGIVAPAIYTGSYCPSFPTLCSGLTSTSRHNVFLQRIIIPTLLTHTSPKPLAKQWLQAYQYGPVFVPPLILGGAISNAILAYFSPPSTPAGSLYILAAAGVCSIIPYTALYMEPGINGAAKWKAQSLLADDGLTMGESNGGPDVTRHTATPEARKWADGHEMKDIVQRWSEINGWRWVIMCFAMVASGVASNWTW